MAGGPAGRPGAISVDDARASPSSAELTDDRIAAVAGFAIGGLTDAGLHDCSLGFAIFYGFVWLMVLYLGWKSAAGLTSLIPLGLLG
jgi:hypothetical protein